MNWQKEFEAKIVSAEFAVSHVRSGELVAMPTGRNPLALGRALAARRHELHGIEICVHTPSRDFGWFDQGWADSFEISIGMVMPVAAEAFAAKRLDMVIRPLDFAEHSRVAADVVMVEVSPPDKQGYCSFGPALWDKVEQCRLARLVVAEINPRLIRTYGENYIHVSEIDYFVEHQSSGREYTSDLLARKEAGHGLPAYVRAVAEHVSTLINDGDTLEIGVGTTSEPLLAAGVLEGKYDLGWHSEVTPGSVIALVRRGVINGSRKTLNRHKCICTTIGGGSPEDMAYVDGNPSFELHPGRYVVNMGVIAAHDQMVAINNALTIDLTGQISAEQIGRTTYSVAGGQTAFAIGAMLSKGGRSISVLPSTAKNGTVSRIVPELEKGTVVTVPRNAADYVVTEFGIASLRDKTRRQRAEAMIEIAHPAFRDWLRDGARELYWP